MDGHQRVKSLYDRLNARVPGVSRSDLGTSKQFVQWLSLEFPLASAATSRMGVDYGVYPNKPPYPPTFEKRVLIIDKKGIVRYVRDGSPDFEFGFLRIEGDFPNQTTFVYDDQPYGNSQDLERRAKQYETLYFMNTGLLKTSSKIQKTEVMGQPAVIIQIEGRDPQGEKARSKIYLVKRGEWVVSFLCTQWRSTNAEFNPKDFEIFDTFARSFKHLKPSRFEDIIERIKNLKG